MSQYVLLSDTLVGTIEYSGEKTEKEILEKMQASEPENKWHTCTKVPKGKHVCKYCGGIAEGDYQDLLCQDCRETFGHTMFTEL